MGRLISLTALAVGLGCLGAQAQYTDGTIKIGVMNDMSGTYADLSGQGSVIAARMAVEDFGAVTKGMKVEIVGADHVNKPDVGSNIVRKWIDTDKVGCDRRRADLLGRARGQRDRARQKQGVPSHGRRHLRPDRRELHPEHHPLDLRHLGTG